MRLLQDVNGNPVQGAFNYGVGQSVSYTGTAAKTGQPIGTTQGTGTITGATVPNDGDTIVIGDKTYTFKTALTPTEGEVLINVTLDGALLNLIRAINHTGTPDTDYKCAAAHDQVSAGAAVLSGHKVALTALIGDDSNNSIAITPDGVRITADATLSGGVSDRDIRDVVVLLTTNGFVKVGDSSVAATVNDIPVGASIPLIIQVGAGDYVSAIRETSSGTCYVKELL